MNLFTHLKSTACWSHRRVVMIDLQFKIEQCQSMGFFCCFFFLLLLLLGVFFVVWGGGCVISFSLLFFLCLFVGFLLFIVLFLRGGGGALCVGKQPMVKAYRKSLQTVWRMKLNLTWLILLRRDPKLIR